MSLIIRPIEQNDAESCGKIGYEAHKAIRRLLDNPNSWGVLAERHGKTLGSIFLHEFPPSPVAAIGPLTVHPSEEGGGVGKVLMNAAITHAHKQNHDPIRLVQSPSHLRSFVLYTKCGFTLREPLYLIQAQPF
jgi:predicted N-acetyltransferase YhbS